MSYTFRIDDDQLDEIIRVELEFQRDCCEPTETALIEAFEKVIEVFTPPSEIVAQEYATQETYMYGDYANLPSDQKITKVSYHFGV